MDYDVNEIPEELLSLLSNPEVLEREIKKRTLQEDYKEFVRFVFEEIWNRPFLDNWHIDTFAKIAHKIVAGEMQYVMINIPPRYAKTTFMTICFVAWSMTLNPQSLFLHLSNSKNLVLENSADVRGIIQHPKFRELWGVELKDESKAKEKWYTLEGGGMYSVPSNGQVIGFGAGRLGSKKFAGAIIIDDPNKAGDVDSDILRAGVNNNFNKTIISRVNDKKTPIVWIMQRLHEDDLCGFILSGSTEIPLDKIHHINIPAINEDGPTEYDPREVGEVLWEDKHTLEELANKELHTPNEYYGQYQQRPAPESGILFDVENLKYYDDLPGNISEVQISWDTAFKDKEINDPTVGTVWGIVRGAHQDEFYLMDVIRRRLKYPELKRTLKAFSIKYNANMNLVEDKASGQSLVQDLQHDGFKKVKPIQIKGSKIERAQASTDMFLTGRVHLPKTATWLKGYVHELMMFPNGKHDDQVDSTTLFLNTRLRAQANIRLLKLG